MQVDVDVDATEWVLGASSEAGHGSLHSDLTDLSFLPLN
jgi:hypothetical protein